MWSFFWSGFYLDVTACVRLYLRCIPQEILISLSRSLIIGGQCMPFWSTCGEKKITGKVLRWDPDRYCNICPWSKIIISFNQTRILIIVNNKRKCFVCWQRLAIYASENLEAMIPPLFLRFLNLLMNDAIYLLDEAIQVLLCNKRCSQAFTVHIQIQFFVYSIQLGCLM